MIPITVSSQTVFIGNIASVSASVKSFPLFSTRSQLPRDENMNLFATCLLREIAISHPSAGEGRREEKEKQNVFFSH
jgi:hypothetical protein